MKLRKLIQNSILKLQQHLVDNRNLNIMNTFMITDIEYIKSMVIKRCENENVIINN